jgi:uncharacterized protein YceK
MRYIPLLLLLILAPSLGCGTFSAHFDGFNPEPYAGVKVTCDSISRACTSEESLNLYASAAPEMRCLAATGELANRTCILACYSIDLPFSLVADTLLWPVQLCRGNTTAALSSHRVVAEPASHSK